MRIAFLRASSLWRMASLRSFASCSSLAALGGGLLLAPDAGRLEVLSTAGLGQDAGLLDQLVEPLQRLLEALVGPNLDFRQAHPSRREIGVRVPLYLPAGQRVK